MRRVTVLAAVIATAGVGCDTDKRESSVRLASPFPAVPEIHGLSLKDAFERLEETGWHYEPGVSSEISARARYATASAKAGSAVGPRRYDKFSIVCGGTLSCDYVLGVVIASDASECRRLARRFGPTPRLVMVDRRQGKLQYWAIWGWTPVIQSYPPVGHVLISPGTCARPARQRAYHDVGSVSVATLRETTWALRWRQRCITHRGSRVLEPNAIPIRNSVRTRRLDGGRLVVTGPDGRVVAQRLGPNRTRITAHMTHADDSSGSGLYYVHLRPGTCARVAAPEIPLTPTGLVVPTVVQIPFARLTRTPHVVEGHDSLSGATVATCIRLDGHPK